MQKSQSYYFPCCSNVLGCFLCWWMLILLSNALIVIFLLWPNVRQFTLQKANRKPLHTLQTLRVLFVTLAWMLNNFFINRPLKVHTFSIFCYSCVPKWRKKKVTHTQTLDVMYFYYKGTYIEAQTWARLQRCGPWECWYTEMIWPSLQIKLLKDKIINYYSHYKYILKD